MAVVIGLTIPLTFTTLAIALARDPVARRQPLRIIREGRKLFRGPIFRGIMGDLAVYMRPGFHPDDVDTDALLDRWQRELFGTQGILLDHLK